MTNLINNIIKIKIKKLKFIIKTLDNYRPYYNSSNSSDDTDKDDNDFASYLFDTKIKAQINIIEIEEDLTDINKFKLYSTIISKNIYCDNSNNPEFFYYRNYNIHLRFSIINNKKYLIIIIDNKNNYEMRHKSTNIIQNFQKFQQFIFNPILFDIDFDIFSKYKSIKNLIKIKPVMFIFFISLLAGSFLSSVPVMTFLFVLLLYIDNNKSKRALV
jgi:hypothetical protein